MDKATNVDFKDEAAQAGQLEAEAKAQADLETYTHKLQRPFTWEGRRVEELHFDWGSLTGQDYVAVEDTLLRRGVTLVMPEYTGGFLCGMAVRACTDVDKDKGGARFVDEGFLQGLPLREYKAILGRARGFLLRQG